MKKVTVRELRKYLSDRAPEELIDDIVALYTRHDSVKEFYAAQLQGTYNVDTLDKYKSIVRQEFFPARGYGSARLSVARKAVTDYKKIARLPEPVIDLMLYYVEMGVAYTRQYGDIDAPFYLSMESMYESALKLIAQHGLQKELMERCSRIARGTDGMGWGFNDTVVELYDSYFADEEFPDDEAADAPGA